MKFYSKDKTLSVIDRIAKRRIALFEDGKFETNDPKLIKRLKRKFRFEDKVVSGLASFIKLKKEAIEKGVYIKGMKKIDLIKVLERGEKNEK